MHWNGPDGADHGWYKENGADGRARDGLGEVSGSIHVVTTSGFQNKVLTKGYLQNTYYMENKIGLDYIHQKYKTLHVPYKLKENTTNLWGKCLYSLIFGLLEKFNK